MALAVVQPVPGCIKELPCDHHMYELSILPVGQQLSGRILLTNFNVQGTCQSLIATRSFASFSQTTCPDSVLLDNVNLYGDDATPYRLVSIPYKYTPGSSVPENCFGLTIGDDKHPIRCIVLQAQSHSTLSSPNLPTQQTLTSPMSMQSSASHMQFSPHLSNQPPMSAQQPLVQSPSSMPVLTQPIHPMQPTQPSTSQIHSPVQSPMQQTPIQPPPPVQAPQASAQQTHSAMSDMSLAQQSGVQSAAQSSQPTQTVVKKIDNHGHGVLVVSDNTRPDFPVQRVKDKNQYFFLLSQFAQSVNSQMSVKRKKGGDKYIYYLRKADGTRMTSKKECIQYVIDEVGLNFKDELNGNAGKYINLDASFDWPDDSASELSDTESMVAN